MKKGVALLVMSALLFIAAIIVGMQSMHEARLIKETTGAQVVIDGDKAPTVVLPPEQLPQFKNISVYTPKKPEPEIFINPPDDNQKPTEESKNIQTGVL